MYNILSGCLNPNQITMIGILAAFLLTFICLKFPFPFLPVDHGREFAVNGALSKGKTRGVGHICNSIYHMFITFYAYNKRIYNILYTSVCNNVKWIS